MKENIMQNDTKQSTPMAYIVRKGENVDSLTICLDGKPYTVSEDRVNFKMLIKSIQANDKEAVKKFLTVTSSAETVLRNSNIEVKNSRVFYKGKEQHGTVVNRIIEQSLKAMSPINLINFLDRLNENENKVVKEYLYSFLEHKDIAIDNDGYCWGYKAITNDWKDKWTREWNYSLGEKPTMPRSQADSNPDNTCGAGFNIGNMDFVRGYAYRYGQDGGDRIVIVRFNPKDVCCVPYQATMKLRCCSFEVMQEFKGQLPPVITNSFDAYKEDFQQPLAYSYLDEVWENWD